MAIRYFDCSKLHCNVLHAFLFDLDQTLIDRGPSIRAFLPQQFGRCAPPGTQEDCEAYVRRFAELDANGYANKEHLYEVLRDEFDLRASVSELVRDFRTNCYRNVFLFSDAVEVLTVLRERGHRLGIVSNGSAEAQSSKITASGLDALADMVLISEVVGLRKPSRELFYLAAGELDLEPSDCMFVGDDPERDIVGAGGAGMRTAWLAHGRAWPTELKPTPDVVLKELRHLLTVEA